MRILILAPRLPWPPTDGGRVAMARLAESLARGGADVEILSLNPRKHRGTPTGPLPIRAIDIDTSRAIVPRPRVPYVVARFVSNDFRSALRETLRRFDPDVVQIESPFLLPYAPLVRAESRARVVLRSLNVEFRIWESLARSTSSVLRRFAYQRIAASLRRYEVREMNRLDAIVPISREDADDFHALGVRAPMHVVPCGVTAVDADDTPREANRVGFIGSLDYLPNQEAVRWIVRDLWPRVAREMPEARLSIAGSSAPSWLAELAGDALVGRVPDAAAFVRAQSVIIAPLFAGGGMRIKVLEAMAHGSAIVATTIGAGGVSVEDGADIVIADDVDSFAAAVIRLLRDPAAAARLGAAARTTVARHYDNDLLGRDLLRFYASL